MIRLLELEAVALLCAFLALVALAAVCHRVGRPPMAARYPLTFWVIDLAAIPLTVLIGAELVARTAVALGLVVQDATLEILGIGLLHMAGVWLAARGLELIVWRGYFAERTG